MFKSVYFDLGHVVVTNGINNMMMENKEFSDEVLISLKRFCTKDWGDICEDDAMVNESALEYPDDLYLLGAYQTSLGKIWIITERISEVLGDNGTTILFPSER